MDDSQLDHLEGFKESKAMTALLTVLGLAMVVVGCLLAVGAALGALWLDIWLVQAVKQLLLG